MTQSRGRAADVPAMVLTESRSLEVVRFPRPQVGPDDGLLKVELAGICRTDVDILHGSFPAALPLIMGHEIVGTIDEVGERAAARWGVHPGDRVVVEPVVGCGHCRHCLAGGQRFCADAIGYGTLTSCVNAPHLFGAYAPLLYLAPGATVVRLPERVSVARGLLSTVAVSNAFRWTAVAGRVSHGDHVVVQGVGPIGLSCLAVARAMGAGSVTAVGLSKDISGLALAVPFGADRVVAADAEDVLDIVRHSTDDELADVVVDTTGSPASIQRALELVRPTGTVVSAGVTGSGTLTPLPLDVLLAKEIQLQGVYSFDSASLRRAVDFVADSSVPFEQLITHQFPLADAQAALNVVADGARGDRLKVALIPEHDVGDSRR